MSEKRTDLAELTLWIAGGNAYSDSLLWPLGFMIASLGTDMLHYALATLMWGPYQR